MKITVCIGSSCHVKGSRDVVAALQTLVAENNLKDKIELGGTFCMGQCQKGVCVSLNEEIFSVTPESVDDFFKSEVLARL